MATLSDEDQVVMTLYFVDPAFGNVAFIDYDDATSSTRTLKSSADCQNVPIMNDKVVRTVNVTGTPPCVDLSVGISL